jgi:hypothetical protein
MRLLETTVAAIGRLALAAAYDERALGGPGPKAAVYTVAALAWISERHKLTRHKLDHDAKAAVRFKDLLVAGLVITGLADVAARRFAGHKRPNSTGLARRMNHLFVAGAVAATPFINFGLFNAYKPHPIRSMFKL